MDGVWIVYLFLAAFPALIVFAAIYKSIQVMQAAHWPSVQGRIVQSVSETRAVRRGVPDAGDTEKRTFAKIVYEYAVARTKYRCDRVSIGEDLGNFEVAETIAKYPVGKMVAVYYNPNKRSEAVLERDAPAGLWKVVAGIVVGMLALFFGAKYGFSLLVTVLEGVVRDSSNAPFIACCIGFSALAALIIWGIQRNAARQQTWPTVPGTIEKSEVREFQEVSESQSGSQRRSTAYRADIIYGYDIAGVHYTGDTSSAMRVSSNVQGSAKKKVAANPVGKTVQVHVNPKNPAESALDGASQRLWMLWLIPIAVLVLGCLVAWRGN